MKDIAHCIAQSSCRCLFGTLWESLATEHNDIFVSVLIIFNSFATKVGLPLPLYRNYRHALRFLPLARSSAQVIPALPCLFFLMGGWGLLSIVGSVSFQQSFRTFSNRSEHYLRRTFQTKVTATFLPHKCQNMNSVSPSSPKSWWLLRSINHIPGRALSTSFSASLCMWYSHRFCSPTPVSQRTTYQKDPLNLTPQTPTM